MGNEWKETHANGSGNLEKEQWEHDGNILSLPGERSGAFWITYRVSSLSRGSPRGSLVLKRQQLFRPERFVVDLSRRLDQILEVGPCQEVSQVDKLAVVFVLNINHTPAVLPTTYGFSVNDHIPLRANYRKWDDVPNTFIELCFLLVVLVSIKRVKSNVVVQQLGANSFLKVEALIERERVRLGDDWNNVHDFAELLHHDNVNGTERMTGGIDEEKTAMNAGVLDITVSLSSQLFPEVG